MAPATATIPVSPDPGTTSRSSSVNTLVSGLGMNRPVGAGASLVEIEYPIAPSVAAM